MYKTAWFMAMRICEAMHDKAPRRWVERGGSARSFHIDSTSIADIALIIRMNARRQSMFMTDEA